MVDLADLVAKYLVVDLASLDSVLSLVAVVALAMWRVGLVFWNTLEVKGCHKVPRDVECL